MERRALIQALAVLCAVLLAGALVERHQGQLALEGRRRAAQELARGSAFAIEQAFSRSLAAVSALAAMAAEGATDRQLDRLATRLLELDGEAASLQLARDGVITNIWPLAGNEAARGLDLARSPRHGPVVRALVEARRPVLDGPFDLVQGGLGLALRIPVFVEERTGGRFWGLSSAIVRVERLLAESRIPRLVEAGYDYELARVDGGAGLPLASSRPAPGRLADPVVVQVDLPGQRWSLAVEPMGGWATGRSGWAARAAVLLVALLAAGLAYRVLSQPAMLRREVAARTAELEVAHREQLRAEDAQRQSQKLEAIGLLAGGVAHDFNNLLVGILGHADLLALDAAPGSPVEEAARTISQAAQRAAQLTRQLLAFARLGPQRRVEVDLHALAQEVATLLQRTIDKSIQVVLRLEAPLHHVLGDPGQLQQVVLNLAVNARDAMPESGTLAIETALEVIDAGSAGRGLVPGRYLVLAVNDTGVGIAPEHLERIFEPFFTTKAEGQGSGLGLATVYGIVKGHGGAVTVHSELGQGTRFMVHLPVRPGSGVAAALPAVEVPHGQGLVLVVDDEEIVRRTAGRMLASLGYQPVLLPGGEAALEWLTAHPAGPGAVLLDLSMPGMDGRTCFRRLRAALPGVKVIITSGFSRDGRLGELLEEGAAGFVAKPYRTAELAQALRTTLGS